MRSFSPLNEKRVESVFEYFEQQVLIGNQNQDEFWVALHSKYIDRVKKSSKLETIKSELTAKVAETISAMDIDVRISNAVRSITERGYVQVSEDLSSQELVYTTTMNYFATRTFELPKGFELKIGEINNLGAMATKFSKDKGWETKDNKGGGKRYRVEALDACFEKFIAVPLERIKKKEEAREGLKKLFEHKRNEHTVPTELDALLPYTGIEPNAKSTADEVDQFFATN